MMIGYVSRLVRFKIALMVGLSAFAGGLLHTHHIGTGHLYGVLGAVFLSFGCSALNQYQEREQDSLMERTSSRPLPSAVMKPLDVLMLSVIFLLLSFCFFMLTDSFGAVILSLLTVWGYNFIYTPFKLKSPFALLIGSVIGSLPPLIGFCSAGGSFMDIKILTVTCILYLWQTPHFAVLSEKYAEDYARAGFKTITSKYGSRTSGLFINVWTFAYVSALLFVPVSGLYKSSAVASVHAGMTIFFCFLILLRFNHRGSRFHFLNISAALFFLLIMTDSFFSR